MSSKSDDAPEGTVRYSDSVSEPDQTLPPIQGFEDQPLVSLEEAVKPLASLVPQVDHMVWTVKRTIRGPKENLSENESASIMLYTLEWPPPGKPLFAIFNEDLRSKNREKLKPWFLYLRLFVHALSKLSSNAAKVIYRGVKLDLTAEYSEGKEFIWWAFSSCTSSLSVLENHVGKVGKRTLFNITFHSAKDISQHSFYPEEKEVLFYPARQFKVNSAVDLGNDLHVVHVEEAEPPFSLFPMPNTVTPSPAPPFVNPSINILLIGEQGVGKSTFINAFVNYLSFPTVAEVNRPIVLKPLSFRLMTNDTFAERTCTFGDFHEQDPSTTSPCQTYTFDPRLADGKKLSLIDTPSLKDAQEFDQDNTDIIEHILGYVDTLSHLNAICFLLQPDAARLFTGFHSCFGRLMHRLGRSVRNNVIFCFADALTTSFTPGSTARLLRTMFASHSMNDMPFNRENTFFFENESFRYLVAAQNGIQFNTEERAEYTMSWPESVQESKRLLDCVRRRPIHRIV